MRHLRRVLSRLEGSLRSRRETDLAEELASHIELLTEANLRRGLPPEEARRQALLKFGGITATKEAYRDQRTLPWFENLAQDLRYAIRGLRKQPGFAAVAITCLALGIGANTAIFSLVNAVMLRMLPVKDPQQLIVLEWRSNKTVPRNVFQASTGQSGLTLPYPTLEYLQKTSRTVSGVFGFVPLGFVGKSLAVSLGGQPLLARGEMVSGGYFSCLGVVPLLGRVLTGEDEKPGAPNSAVLSYAYWKSQLGGESSAIGRKIVLNAVPFQIVGVAPPEFFGVNPEDVPDIWVAMRDQPGVSPWGIRFPQGQTVFAVPRWWWLQIMVRLKPGVTEPQARQELNALFQHRLTVGLNPPPKPEDLPRLKFTPGSAGLNFLRQRFSKPLTILMAAVLLVLLIACSNVATLLVSRAAARQREIGIRLAIGASRGRLIRQFLTESLVLGVAGGTLGLLLAYGASRALLLTLTGHAEPPAVDLRLDTKVLLFCAAISLATGILFGLFPALRATRVHAVPEWKGGTRITSPRFGLVKTLVTSQVAFSLLLLIAAGLFVRTLQNLVHQDLGFNRENLLVFGLDARRVGYKGDRLRALYEEALSRIQAVPGVRAATTSQMALMTGWANVNPITTDRGGPKGNESSIYSNGVGPAFFDCMQIPILAGRAIDWRDIRTARNVAVVNQALAQHFFPGGNAVGHHFNLGEHRDLTQDYEIVGIAGNAKYDRLREDIPRTAYLPQMQDMVYVAVRAAGNPAALVPTLRRVIQSVDPNLPLIDPKTQTEQIEQSAQGEQMFARLSSLFGILALLLVSIGLYGTLAFGVARRTSEIGIRTALGAPRAGVLWMILRESLLLVASGVALGLPIALALSRYVASELYGVKPNDLLTISAAVALLAAVGAVSGYLPARRASRVDPVIALRYE